MLIMEYSPLGNLLQFLRKKRLKVSRSALTTLLSNDSENQSNDDESANLGLTSKQLTMFAYQIAKGLRHLHRNRIIHRDVAARNVLLFDNLLCKVADLGLARHLSDSDGDVYETKSEGPLPVRWMAPESLRDRIYSYKSDVWSYGILLWEIVTLGGSPYQGRSAHKVVQDVLNGQTMSRPDHCAPELFSLMNECWRQDPESRPDFDVLSRNLDTLLEESSNYIKLLDYQDHLYTIIQGSCKSDAEEKL
ncbi:tyrosine-protein kinase receptor Tie-1-like [Haliotis rubra]|uniref:tyrosine-protein kinase receptor Tie-1-like n=1 Tax=Haliotis rubra TaxID=36100 RepID=UPI001EE5E2E5|nr:tyrosine-protein kinase receptor Tie-1-like [Haliotis rubra]